MNTTTTDQPDIAVIIPHYNDVDRLERCLGALMKNEIGQAEILVVDNNSPNPPDRLHDQFPSVRFLTETEKGAGPARNKGVANSTAELLIFIDADCVPDHSWLTVARQVAHRADLIGGRVDVFDETPPPRNGAEAFETVFAFDQKTYIETKGFSITANLITSRKTFSDVGLFGNGISEDYDWCTRAREKGYRLSYAPELQVAHPSRSNWEMLKKKWQRLTQESFALSLQNNPGPSGRLKWGVKSLLLPFSIPAHLPRIFFSKRLSSLGEKSRAAQTLFKLRLLRMWWAQKQAIFGKI